MGKVIYASDTSKHLAVESHMLRGSIYNGSSPCAAAVEMDLNVRPLPLRHSCYEPSSARLAADNFHANSLSLAASNPLQCFWFEGTSLRLAARATAGPLQPKIHSPSSLSNRHSH